MKKRKKRGIFAVLTGLCLVTFCIGMCFGRYPVSLKELCMVLASRFTDIPVTWSKNTDNVVWAIRLPRMCGAFLVGAGLSISGATYQGIFQNPLVSPDLLGVSAGACVGASIAILCGWPSAMIQLLALLGGLLAVALTNLIPILFRNKSNLMLVLAGIIVSGFFNSAQGLLKYVADPDTQLALITFWTMGSLAKVDTASVLSVMPGMLISMGILLCLRWRINLLAIGETEAHSLGVHITRLRGISILCATILTASSICIAGTVGWIGLVVPHFGRLLVGSDNKKLMPASLLIGAAFLMLIDTFARNLAGTEVPLSILTGFIGAPAFLILLVVQKSRV
ncbi:MAG: iron ABC transporter permease [Eubacteriales bacterium]|nr:iron ABC transporter permease [Eubacteriales bacterium]